MGGVLETESCELAHNLRRNLISKQLYLGHKQCLVSTRGRISYILKTMSNLVFYNCRGKGEDGFSVKKQFISNENGA